MQNRFRILINNTMTVMVIVLFFFSCNSKQNTFPSIADRSQMPVLRANDVVTMVSDSGVTRYRVSAPEWLVYDKAEEPFWDFPKGAIFERFDNDYKTDASIKADSVVYYYEKKLWRMSGHVDANNLKDENFQTELLFWDQSQARIYTDKKVKVTQTDKIIEGYGFESNQTLDKYTLKNVNAIIPIDESD